MQIGIFSFFSGLGLLDHGFESIENVNVLYVSEIQKSFLDAYRFTRNKLGISEPEFGFNQEDIRDNLQEKQISRLKTCLKNAKRKMISLVSFRSLP